MTVLIRRALGALAVAAALIVSAPVTGPSSSDQAVAATPQGCLPASLKRALSGIRKNFGKPTVISTHRPGATIRGTGRRSKHASCAAVDFHPPKGKYKAVLAWLKRNHKGGIGTYSGTHHHIHIDNGPRTRWHRSY